MGTRCLFCYRYIFLNLISARRENNSSLTIVLAPRATRIHFLRNWTVFKGRRMPVTHSLASSAPKECSHLQKGRVRLSEAIVSEKTQASPLFSRCSPWPWPTLLTAKSENKVGGGLGQVYTGSKSLITYNF